MGQGLQEGQQRTLEKKPASKPSQIFTRKNDLLPRPRWWPDLLPSSTMPGPRNQAWSCPSPFGPCHNSILPQVSPCTMHAITINQAMPYNYPVPLKVMETCPTCQPPPGLSGPKLGVAYKTVSISVGSEETPSIGAPIKNVKTNPRK